MAHDREGRRGRGYRIARAAALAALSASLVTGAAVGAGAGRTGAAVAATLAPASPAAGSRMALMRAAAREFGVPVSLLLAISYNQSRWDRPGDAPSVDGGYGLMDLTTRSFPADDGRGDAARALRTVTVARTHDTLDEAAHLLQVPAVTLRTSERQNIRGAAALLARYGRGLAGGALPASLGGWYGAVAEYSGATTELSARRYADDVFATLRGGESLTTTDGQVLGLPPRPRLQPDRAQLSRLGLKPAAGAAVPTTAADCPSTLSCSFVPAAYAQGSPADPANYGNYDTAGRPDQMLNPAGQTVSMKISYIIIHDTEGSYNGAISTFQNPASHVSANYVIRSSDGAVTEMVRPSNVSWGAGDWYINMHAINIENEGFAAQGGTWYTEAMYRSDASLVRYLAATYGIPLDRAHILGHEDLPGPADYWTSVQHWDPGPFWNWNHFMALVHAVGDPAEQARGGSVSRGAHRLVTIDPTFAANEPALTNCSGTGCSALPKQPANFVYLHTGPGSSYPLIGDPVLHSDGSNGTSAASDWGDKATTGETFVAAGQSGSWTAIWFGGRKGWFYNPPGIQQEALYTSGEVITPKAGLTSIPVYGTAYPEASAYPPAVPVRQIAKLSYTIPGGQAYPTIGTVSTDYYYAATINSSLAADHTVIIGATAYDQISFNHRKFFVRASDVTVQSLP